MYLVTHTFKCKECGEEVNLSYQYEKYQLQAVNFPIGWSETPNGYICNKHTLIITDKIEENS